MIKQTRNSRRYVDLVEFVHGAANRGKRGGPTLQEVYDSAVDALRRHGVPFVLHGALAMSSYGYERATGDIDLLVPERSTTAIRAAMAEIGAVSRRKVPRGDEHMQFNLSGWILDFFRDADFDGLVERAEKKRFAGKWILVISKGDLIQRKLARGTALDISDVKRLTGRERA